MDFNKWKEESLSKGELKTWIEWCELAFKAGQKSKQAEIDKLQKQINDALELINNQHDTSTIKFVRYAINKILKGE